MQFGQSCVCVGNRNDFHVFSTSIVVAHILQHDAHFEVSNNLRQLFKINLTLVKFSGLRE